MEFMGFKIKTSEHARPGQMLFDIGGGRYIGIDTGSGDMTAEVEMQWRADGSIEVLDVRHYPPTKEPKV